MATIQQLKFFVRSELGVSDDEVRSYGPLTRKATWQSVADNYQQSLVQKESALYELVPLAAPVPSGIITETASFVPPPPTLPTVIPLPEPEEKPEEDGRDEEAIADGKSPAPEPENAIAPFPLAKALRMKRKSRELPFIKDSLKKKSLAWLKKYVRSRGACDTFVARFGEYIHGQKDRYYPINSKQAWFEVALWLETADLDPYRYFCGFWLHSDERTFISKIGLDSNFWKQIKTLTFYRGIHANSYLDFYYEVCRCGSLEGAAKYLGYPLLRQQGKHIPGRSSDKSTEPAASLFFEVHRYLFAEWEKRLSGADVSPASRERLLT